MTDLVKAVITDQADQLEKFLRVLAPVSQDYALLDFPNYPNVGDSAIWLGETALLRKVMGRGPAYACMHDSFDPERFRCAVPSGPIYMSGGGNFGDIWPRHQEFRLRILQECRDRRVIQLPQSIAFRDPSHIAETAKAIASHTDFHLLVRDKNSERFARGHFDCPVHLLPDAAFALGPLPRPPVPLADTVLLLRTDIERASYDRSAFGIVPATFLVDWLIEPAADRSDVERNAIIKALVTGAWSRDARRLVYYDTLARNRLDRGLRILAGARVVITDRLHGHILSVLLNIPHVVLDNDYGKISAYVDAWTSTIPNLRRAKDSGEAMQKLDEFLQNKI